MLILRVQLRISAVVVVSLLLNSVAEVLDMFIVLSSFLRMDEVLNMRAMRAFPRRTELWNRPRHWSGDRLS